MSSSLDPKVFSTDVKSTPQAFWTPSHPQGPHGAQGTGRPAARQLHLHVLGRRRLGALRGSRAGQRGHLRGRGGPCRLRLACSLRGGGPLLGGHRGRGGLLGPARGEWAGPSSRRAPGGACVLGRCAREAVVRAGAPPGGQVVPLRLALRPQASGLRPPSPSPKPTLCFFIFINTLQNT